MAEPVMQEREEPRLIQFSTGDCVDGVLVSMEKLSIRDKATGESKPAVKYVVEQDSGVLLAFWGTHQLNMKLRPSDRGHLVSIRCEGEDTMVNRNGNNMKVFKVLVSKEPAKDGDLYISDSDIPF
jgi:hypothetical protein